MAEGLVLAYGRPADLVALLRVEPTAHLVGRHVDRGLEVAVGVVLASFLAHRLEPPLVRSAGSGAAAVLRFAAGLRAAGLRAAPEAAALRPVALGCRRASCAGRASGPSPPCARRSWRARLCGRGALQPARAGVLRAGVLPRRRPGRSRAPPRGRRPRRGGVPRAGAARAGGRRFAAAAEAAAVPVLRARAAFFATSRGWLENCLPAAVSRRFLAVVRAYSSSDSFSRALRGR